LITIIRAGAELGISRVRITGGEPLVRLGVVVLSAWWRKLKGQDISMTTKSSFYRNCAKESRSRSHRVNISLDTLKPERFQKICRHGDVNEVISGIEAARAAGLNPVKINVVVMTGVNDDEILDFARKTIDDEWHVAVE
jgi:cyclic pyranopterin phosphate synthase